MVYYEKDDLKALITAAVKESQVWREDYPAFERLMDNGLLPGLDKNLPEVNDGSLAAALFKLPKRIVNRDLTGTVKAIDRDEAWLAELANMRWQNEIIPNAISQAPFDRKWKDAVRKAAGYGSVPLITLNVERNDCTYTDFIVAQPQDVRLEPGKVSDYDSDVIMWDVYYTKNQLQAIIDDAKEDANSANEDNKWSIAELQDVLAGKMNDERDPRDTPRTFEDGKGDLKPKGYKFTIVFQRGIDAPFYMYHVDTNRVVREWTNPDPSGDMPIHYLYCYQDFINPYGIGIVKLAGGTQNVLDIMRKYDVLATQIGLKPPIQIKGQEEDVDIDSMVYAEDALWFTGNAEVERMEMADGVYNGLPARMQMYQSSLQKLIPTGDTSLTAAESGDATQSKTPAGVKLAAANLSIDDDDFKDNLYVTYEAVARSMINTHFANMEGTDMMKLSDDERDILRKAGLEFPEDENGEMSNQLEVEWDTVRATFNFHVDPEVNKAKDDADKLEGLTKVAELTAQDPTIEQDLAAAGKKFNKGELFAEIIKLTTDNDKIITDIDPEEETAMQGGVDPATGEMLPPEAMQPQTDPMMEQQMAHADEKHQMEMQGKQQDMDLKMQKAQGAMQMQTPVEDPNLQEAGVNEQAPMPPEVQADMQEIMQQYGVDENTALAALAAEHQGLPIEDIIAHLEQYSQQVQA